jgi:hypothetical protein
MRATIGEARQSWKRPRLSAAYFNLLGEVDLYPGEHVGSGIG